MAGYQAMGPGLLGLPCTKGVPMLYQQSAEQKKDPRSLVDRGSVRGLCSGYLSTNLTEANNADCRAERSNEQYQRGTPGS